MKTLLTYSIITLGLALSLLLVNAQEKDVVFFEDFESGWGSWWADNGVWEIGIPTVGPQSTHSGQNCAGTDLDANYPSYANTRLVTPQITLPSGHIRLKFWHWYEMSGGDWGEVQISTDGINWESISSPVFDGYSATWTQACVDISAYAGQTVRIGFYFFSNYYDQGKGWYIDDVSVVDGPENFNNPEDFELGVGDWSADNGLWQVGTPTNGPSYTHSGQNCAGTDLDANYPSYANTRLVTPQITLSSSHIRLKFWHWYEMSGGDWGEVQISTDGINWESVSSPVFDGYSATWTQACVDISAYAGQTVRIGFYFFSNYYDQGKGWYIDDVSVVDGPENFNNPEDFELGVGDWSADNGLWQVGTPTNGPSYTHSGQNCAGTDLDANYPSYANTRLVTPQITLSSSHIRLKFWHWYEMSGGDWGEVQISTDGINWESVSSPVFDGYSATWTQACVDISAYAGQTVRIGFYFFSNYYDQGKGWYIDDVSVVDGPENFNNPEDFELGVGDWSADNGLWQVGTPTNGPSYTHSGQNCAGTDLDANYPSYANTRLVSPSITLTTVTGQQPELFFWHWFIMAGGDQGQVQISINGGEWQTVSGFGGPYNGSNETWSQAYVPLSAFIDSTIRLGFYFTSDYYDNDAGWYIDDVRIEGVVVGVNKHDASSNQPSFILHQNHPNPFHDQTTISFEIMENNVDINLSVHNTSGQLIKSLINNRYKKGSYSLTWNGCYENGKKASPGVYFLRLKSERYSETMRIAIVN